MDARTSKRYTKAEVGEVGDRHVLHACRRCRLGRLRGTRAVLALTVSSFAWINVALTILWLWVRVRLRRNTGAGRCRRVQRLQPLEHGRQQRWSFRGASVRPRRQGLHRATRAQTAAGKRNLPAADAEAGARQCPGTRTIWCPIAHVQSHTAGSSLFLSNRRGAWARALPR